MQGKTLAVAVACVLALGAPGLLAQSQCYNQYTASFYEQEAFPDSEATLDIPGYGAVIVNGPFTMKITGPAVVLGDGRCQLNVQMTALNLEGLAADGDLVTVTLAGSSPGTVTQQRPGADYPANSAINVAANVTKGQSTWRVQPQVAALIANVPPPIPTSYQAIMCQIHKITTIPTITRCPHPVVINVEPRLFLDLANPQGSEINGLSSRLSTNGPPVYARVVVPSDALTNDSDLRIGTYIGGGCSASYDLTSRTVKLESTDKGVELIVELDLTKLPALEEDTAISLRAELNRRREVACAVAVLGACVEGVVMQE